MSDPLMNEVLAELRAIRGTLAGISQAARTGCVCPAGAEAGCQSFSCGRKPPPRRLTPSGTMVQGQGSRFGT